MPSPIAHTAAAYAVFRAFSGPPSPSRSMGIAIPALLATALVVTFLPDLPSIAGVILGDLAAFHNNWEHSLVAGLAAAAAIGGGVRLASGRGFGRWFGLALVCYSLHVIMDFFTIGRGVMILWPFSEDRYSPPLKFFYGLHWSEGWLSSRHWWTLITETVFSLLVLILVHASPTRRVFSREMRGD